MRQTEGEDPFLVLMPEPICTCGAVLPEDARFCHKCGRPLRPEDETRLRSALTASAPAEAEEDDARYEAPAVIPALLSFKNPQAVRTALVAATLAFLLNTVLAFGFAIWLVAAGFFAVYLFRKRTGYWLSVSEGVRLGWLTGVLNFAMAAVLFTFGIAVLTGRPGGLSGFYREQMHDIPISAGNLEEALRFLDSPAGVVMLMGTTWAVLFAIIVLFCMAGGALGAKILGKQPQG